MKKTNPLIASFLILIFLNSCGTIAEGLGEGKKKGSDTFLVEKKSPLVLPPSFGELPEPGKEPEENIISEKKDTSDIEDIINQSSSTSATKESDNTKNSIEQSIIKKINEKKYRVYAGPFNNINSLQKSFNDISILEFENIEIIKND